MQLQCLCLMLMTMTLLSEHFSSDAAVLAMDISPKEEMDNEQTFLELTSCITLVAAQWPANLQADYSAMLLPGHIDSRVDQQELPD